MNAAVPPGWRPSFTAKQRRSIGSGAWARGRRRWGFFRIFSSSSSSSSSFSSSSSSFPAIRSLFFFTPSLWGRTLVCLWGQPDALACVHFSPLNLSALQPALRSATAMAGFIGLTARFCSFALCGGLLFCAHLPGGQAPQEQLNVCSWN